MIQLVSSTPVEHEAYFNDTELRDFCDSVGQMIMDLHDEPIHLDIVLYMNDPENPSEFGLAFGGTTLALDFYDDRIDITDFNLVNSNEPEVIQTFSRDEVNAATVWLVNIANNQ